ncbi:hypothetical protein M514_21129, partial [Trichuris suis]
GKTHFSSKPRIPVLYYVIGYSDPQSFCVQYSVYEHDSMPPSSSRKI